MAFHKGSVQGSYSALPGLSLEGPMIDIWELVLLKVTMINCYRANPLRCQN